MLPLKDALYCLHPESGADPAFARGVLIGAVAAVLERRGRTFSDALELVGDYLPDQVHPQAVPTGWEEELEPWTVRRTTAAP